MEDESRVASHGVAHRYPRMFGQRREERWRYLFWITSTLVLACIEVLTITRMYDNSIVYE